MTVFSLLREGPSVITLMKKGFACQLSQGHALVGIECLINLLYRFVKENGEDHLTPFSNPDLIVE
jgi:hypothetical protein